MDKKSLRISALTVLNNELPDVKVFFEDIITQQTQRNGIENLCRFNENIITVLLRTPFRVLFCW